MGNDQIFSLADKLRELRDRKAELEDELKALTAEIDATDKALSDQMAEAEVPKFCIPHYQWHESISGLRNAAILRLAVNIQTDSAHRPSFE